MAANFNRDETYFANITMRSRMTILPEMKKKLHGTRRETLFRETCFGNWLDILHWRLEGHLVHLILQMQVELSQPHDPEVDPLIYEVGGHRLEFGPKQFCLITGLRFGPIDWVKYKAKTIPFRHRVFGHVKTGSIHLDDVHKLYYGPDFSTLTDLDAVRVCLLMVLEFVFLGAGGDMQNVVDLDFLELVEDLDEWNRFPWGSHVWVTTHAQLKDAVPIRRTKHLRGVKQSPPKKPHYTLMGFIWAFKIWILETFPICRDWWLPREDMLPRGIRWDRNVTFKMEHHYLLNGPFYPPNIPRQKLELIPAEASTDWWIASRDCFDNEVKGVVPPPPPGLCRRRQPCTHFFQGDDPAASVTMPPPPPPTAPPTPVPSLEERIIHLQRDHSVLQNDHRELQAFCWQLHQRCLALEQKVSKTQQKQDLVPDPDIVPDDGPVSRPDEPTDNTDLDLNIDLNFFYSPVEDMVNDAIVTAGQPENIQPMQCEVCNVSCNSEDVLEKHKQGKKHLKNLQTLAEATVIAPKLPPPPPIAAASSTLGGELENKKQNVMQDGGSVDKLINCDICNVVCINEDVYQAHVAGKKHSAKAVMQLVGANVFFNPTSEGNSKAQRSGASQKKPDTLQCELCNISCTSNELLKLHLLGKKHLKKLKESGLMPQSIDDKPMDCELCGIICTSYELLQVHISGKKHLKNLEKSGKPSGPNPAPITQPASTSKEEGEIVKLDGSNRNAKRAGSHEDLETKKQKVLQGGAASDALRTCTVCSVVCNSPSVFFSHLVGQKHAAMALKQAEARSTVKET